MCFRRFLNSVVLSLLVIVSVQAHAATRDPIEYFFHPSFGDLREELQTARSEGKSGLLVMFDNAECPWCLKMKTSILNQDVVQDYYRKHFQIIRIDTEGGNPIVDFDGTQMKEKDFTLKVNRVRATPVLIFYGLDGKQLARYTGAVSSVDEFMWLGEFVVGGHYKTTNFPKYKRSRKAAGK